MNNAYLLLSILLLISSCSPKITYMMSDIAASEKGNDLNNVSVSIVITGDNRRDESPYKQTIFSDRFKNKVECYNLEKEYYGLSVPSEINNSIVNHLKKKKYFKNVFLNNIDSADFIVSIQLKSFAGNTSINPVAKDYYSQYTGIGGVLISLIDTTKFKSELSYAIDYGTVNILDKNNGISLPTFKFSSSGKVQIPAVTFCYQIYKHLNSTLKTHNDSFVELIASKIEEQIVGFWGVKIEDTVE